MSLRRAAGLLLGAAGLAVVASASAHPPMAGCPAPVTDPAALTLTSSFTVDYCAGSQVARAADSLFLLLNAVGLTLFLLGVTMLALRPLMEFSGSGA